MASLTFRGFGNMLQDGTHYDMLDNRAGIIYKINYNQLMNILLSSFDNTRRSLINDGKIKIKIKKVGLENVNSWGGVSLKYNYTVTRDFATNVNFQFQFDDVNNHGAQKGEQYGTFTGWDTSVSPNSLIITPSSYNYAGIKSAGLEYQFINFPANADYFTLHPDGTYRATQKMCDILNSSPNYNGSDAFKVFNQGSSLYYGLITAAALILDGLTAFAISYSKYIAVTGSAQNFYQVTHKNTDLIYFGKDSEILVGAHVAFMIKTSAGYGAITTSTQFGSWNDTSILVAETEAERQQRLVYFRNMFITLNIEYSELGATQ